MKGLRPLLLVFAAVTAGVVVGILLLARGDGEGIEAPARGVLGPPLRVATDVRPRTHVFGDPVTAQADILVDPRQVDPGTVRIEAVFHPYTPVGSPERAEARAGELVRVRYRFTLNCFAPACVPTGEKRDVDLQSGQIFFLRAGRQGERPVRTHERLAWPSFSVASRLGPFDLERARWRAQTGVLPAVGYRFEPGALAALAFGGALMLLVGAGVLLTTIGPVRRRRTPADVEPEPELTPLERALIAARMSARNGATSDQRRALERLSRELLRAGEPTLAGRARRLAWSAERARPDDVERLAGDIRAARAEKELTA